MLFRSRQLLFCAALSLVPSTAGAYCPGTDKSFPGYNPHYYSVAKEFERSKYVVVATMDRETWLGEDGKPKPLKGPFQYGAKRPWGFDPYAGAYYDLRVQRSFKGAAPSHLRLFSENSTARFWLTHGVSYLLFLSGARFDPPMRYQLTIDTCGNSGTAAGNHLAVLARNLEVGKATGGLVLHRNEGNASI
jgi:hypothetical protein